MICSHCGGSRKGKVEGGSEDECKSLFHCIEKAREDWWNAKIMFEEATQDDQIDSLIYKMNAYERKYIYLLKMAKGEKLNVFPKLR
ncbi:MAG: YaaL family protein [Clostridia bacterium]|nr:YaaL family protein [Clostridia bacterium]